MAQTHYAYATEARDPATAAMLSMIPGLGQFYNGESRKGMLFLDVALINYFLMALILLAPVLTKGMQEFAKQFGMTVNTGVLSALRQMHFGSPVSLIVLGMLIAFVAYAVRDAYDHAVVKRRRSLYSDSVIELPEATSGSYIIHASLILALAVTALFFILPKPLAKQITEIEFVNSVIKQPVERPKTNVHSQNNSKASISKFDRSKPIQKIAPRSEVSKQENQDTKQPKSTAASSSPAAASSASAMPQLRPLPPKSSQSQSTAQAPAPVLSRIAPQMPLPRAAALSQIRPASPALAIAHLPASSASAMMPLPISRQAGSLPPAPVIAASSFASPMALPTIAPSGSLPGASRGPAMPSAHAVSGAKNAVELPGVGSMPVLGGGKISAPIMPSGGPSGRGTSFNPGVPGPVDIPTGGSSKIGAAVPLAMSGSDPYGKGKERGDGSGDAPRPVKGGRSTLGDGPLAVSPSDGRPQSGPADKALNFPGDPGRDRVQTAKDPDFSAYMAELQRRIKRAWSPSKENQSRRVKVLFKVHTGGEMSNLRIVSSSGIAVVDQAALKAVEQSAPFRHLPDGAPENVDIEFTFDYNVFSGRTF